MQNLILLAVLSMLFFSCRTADDEPYQGTCFGGCSDAGRRVTIDAGTTGLTADSLAGRLLRTYVKDNTFSTLIEESDPETIYIDGDHDHEIYYPAINRSIRISSLRFRKTGLPDTCTATGYCVNPVDSALVTFDGVPQEYGDYFYDVNAKELKITLH